MANEPKKCAHAVCTCVCNDGTKYCSQACEDQSKSGTMTLGCDCPHPGCSGKL